MTDDRRDRYAAAMASYAYGHIHEVDGPTPDYCFPLADGAIEVADKEQQDVYRLLGESRAREGRVSAENARLRAELEQLRTRAEKAERAVNLLASVHRRAEQAEAAGGTEPDSHAYLSTSCLHGEHGYCQAHTGLSGAKTPSQCKFCGAKCQCPCHHATTAKEA